MRTWIKKGLIPHKRVGGVILIYVESYLVAYFGDDKQLRDIRPIDAADWFDWLATPKEEHDAQRLKISANALSRATAQKMASIAKTFFRDALKRGMVDSIAFEELPSAAVAASKDAYVPLPQFDAILDKAATPAWRVLIGLTRIAGLRTGEAFLLRWNHVDFETRSLRIPSPKTERHGKAIRTCPIPPALAPLLQDAFDATPVGEVRVVQLSPHNLHRKFEVILQRAGFKPWSPLWHAMRGMAITDYLTRGSPITAVAEWCGNSPEVIAKHYARIPDSVFKAAAGLDDRGVGTDKRCICAAETAENERKPPECTKPDARRELTELRGLQGVASEVSRPRQESNLQPSASEADTLSS